MLSFPDIVGTLGVAFVLSAFFGLQAGRFDPQGWGYLCLNLGGASAILVSLLFHFNLASFLIELAWIGISLFGIARRLLTRRRPSAPRQRRSP